MADIGTHQFVVDLRDNACPVRGTSQYGFTVVVAPGFQVSYTAQNPTCAGATNGSITVTPNGGQAPYQYSINNGATWQASNTFTGLGAGTYTITVRDASGCRVPVTVTLSAPPPINITLVQVTPVRCHGEANGEVSVSVSGGNGGYSFTVNGSPVVPGGNNPYVFSGLSAGVHVIGVTDSKGCQASVNVTVPEPDPLVFGTVVVTPVRCHGEANGEVSVSVSGGNGGYSFTVNGS
ncbi:MAG: SprB repeat-containing protein, partial [Nitrososphaerota archaeon]